MTVADCSSVPPTGRGLELLERDALGQVLACIDAQGQRTAYRYTPEGLLAAVMLADGRIEQARYDAEGNLVQRIDPQGLVTRFEYGPFDKLIASAAQRCRHPLYLRRGAAARCGNQSLGEEWHYRYNAAGQLVEEQDFSGRLRQFDLDIDGQLLAHTDALGQTTRYRRDLLGRLIEKIAPEGSFRFVRCARATRRSR
jgi:YD repeat-containing protein